MDKVKERIESCFEIAVQVISKEKELDTLRKNLSSLTFDVYDYDLNYIKSRIEEIKWLSDKEKILFFVFISLLINCPLALLGKQIEHSYVKMLALFLGIHSTQVSIFAKDARMLYFTNNDFKYGIMIFYGELLEYFDNTHIRQLNKKKEVRPTNEIVNPDVIDGDSFIEILFSYNPLMGIVTKGDILWIRSTCKRNERGLVYLKRESKTPSNFNLPLYYYDFKVVSDEYVKQVIDSDPNRVRHLSAIPMRYKRQNNVFTYYNKIYTY